MKKSLVIKAKYFNGKDGVYYNPMFDTIFDLEYTGQDIVSVKGRRLNFIGKRYWHRDGSHKINVAITGLQNCIRLGDL